MTTATPVTTGALHDALHDLDRSDLATDEGRNRALHAIEYIDRETGRIRDYITAREQQS